MNNTIKRRVSRARGIVEGLAGRLLAGRLADRAEARFDADTGSGAPNPLSTELVVSLTSFPPRFATLHLTLKCLLTQSVRPDRVVLWVATQDRALLPDSVLALRQRGLSIEECEDWRPYKKIIPELVRSPNACIVTADDDVYYGTTWLEKLVTAHQDAPECVVAHRSHLMVTEGAELASYEDWELTGGVRRPSWKNFAVGIGGVLYPPGCLHPDTTDPSGFLEHSPNNDDIWLNWMAKLQGSKCVSLERRFVHTWKDSQVVGLYQTNREERGNDVAIASMVERYGPDDLQLWSD